MTITKTTTLLAAHTVNVTSFADTQYDGGLGWTDNWKVSGTGLYDAEHAPTGMSHVSAASLLFTPTGGTESEMVGIVKTFAADGTGLTLGTSFVSVPLRVAGMARVKLVVVTGTTESIIYTEAKATKPLLMGFPNSSTKVFAMNATAGGQLDVPIALRLEGFGLGQGGEGVAGVTTGYLEADVGGREAFWANTEFESSGKALTIQIDPAEGTAAGDHGAGFLGLNTVDAGGTTQSYAINFAKIMVTSV